jgi:pimeloyl-ACP methyl ester carboxylesterase
MFSEGTLDVTRSLDDDLSSTVSKDDPVTEGEQEQHQQHRRVVGTIRYRVFRPRQMKMLPSPLVVLHGGPGVPSNYLMSLVNVITDRTVIFYDQLGCGRSSRVMEKEAYSLQYCVDDLRALLKHWDLHSLSFVWTFLWRDFGL